MAAKELFAALPPGDCDLATVYRSLHLLESMGMVKRFDLGGGVARFELLAEGDDGHHHHLVCTECGNVVELPDCSTSISEIEESIAMKHGFKRVTHKLEFFGVCTDCQR
jgi:Fur family ferric uptake transcriptional regulator